MRDDWQHFPRRVTPDYHPVELVLYKENGGEFNRLAISRPLSDHPGPTIVWFHGGGLTGDGRECPAELYNGVNTVVEVRYPVYPAVSTLAIIEDAAAAVAWCFRHIGRLGRRETSIFVGGMSAGAYLAALTGMDASRLAPYGIDHRRIAGLMPVSGQMTTHFQVKAELGLPESPVIDALAPMGHLSADLPPVLLITGESGLDMPGRPEENAFMAASLRALGHPDAHHYALPGHDHGGAFDSCDHLLLKFINRIAEAQK